jgi:hypothetical protein
MVASKPLVSSRAKSLKAVLSAILNVRAVVQLPSSLRLPALLLVVFVTRTTAGLLPRSASEPMTSRPACTRVVPS